MREEEIKITENERKILIALTDQWSEETGYYHFNTLEKKTGLDRRIVRLSCRSLTRKSLAEFRCGLVNEDGEMAGAGYGATKKGAALISPCDVCGELCTYEYEGKKECEAHYQQSTKQASLI